MTPRQTRIAVAAGAAVLLVAVLYIAGVGGGTAGPDSRPSIADNLASTGVVSSDCPQPNGALPSEAAGVTAVLLDRTGSVRGAADAPAYTAAVQAEVEDAVIRGDAVVVSGFDGTSATVRWTLVNTAFRGDDGRVLLARDDALRCLTDEVDRAAHGRAEEPDTDVLGALQAAEDPLAAAPEGQRRLLVATDGIVTTGCADLNSGAIGAAVEPVVTGCQGSGQLPDLTGTAVRMLGVGSPGQGQPRPRTTHVNWLADLWTQLCSASGAGECRVSDTGPAATANPVPPGSAADQTVHWPEIAIRSGDGEFVLTVPEDLLFDTDSSALRPGARETLSAVADRVREVSGTVREVVGHTDGRGEPAYNEALSLGRAQAVADGLRTEFGLVAEQPERGAGESDPECTPETRPDGSADRAAQQCNRRVEVVVRLPEGSR